MMRVFEDEEKAGKRVDNITDTMHEVGCREDDDPGIRPFCPIIKGYCNPNCICYELPRTSKRQDGQFEILGHRCSHKMIDKEFD